jgi:hypothetical protein
MRKHDPIQLPATMSATLTDEESLTPVLFAIEVDRTKIGPSEQADETPALLYATRLSCRRFFHSG